MSSERSQSGRDGWGLDGERRRQLARHRRDLFAGLARAADGVRQAAGALVGIGRVVVSSPDRPGARGRSDEPDHEIDPGDPFWKADPVDGDCPSDASENVDSYLYDDHEATGDE